MTNLVASFVSYAKDKGIIYALKRSVKVCVRRIRRGLVSKDVVGKRPIDVMTSVDDVVKADFVTEPYIAPKRINKTKLNIGWVLLRNRCKSADIMSPFSSTRASHNSQLIILTSC